MSCESCVTNRDMQNRDTPNLPFAQELITYQGTTNPDRPDLPFAQGGSRTKGVNKKLTSSTSAFLSVLLKPGISKPALSHK